MRPTNLCQKFCASTILIATLVASQVSAQDVSLDLRVSPVLENAQALSLSSLGISDRGEGAVLLSGYLENLTDQPLKNLYFEVRVSSSRSGIIAELNQRSGQPFSLQPYQSVYITNNDLVNENIPGIAEEIRFTGGLTPEGDNFINSLEGSTTLPQDVYSVEVNVFRVTNQNGRENLASSSVEIGAASGSEGSEIYLKSPGSVVNDGAEITNSYPQFSWEGDVNSTYRLIVVEDNGQDSPESLIQSANSSGPTNEGGSLLSFENMDMRVEGINFQYPVSGAQRLEAGKTYYWRVTTEIQLSGDTERVHSEIWEFELQSSETAARSMPMDQETEEEIINLIGGDRFREMFENGYELEEFEYEGQTYTGAAAMAKLEEILQKIRDDQIIIGNE